MDNLNSVKELQNGKQPYLVQIQEKTKLVSETDDLEVKEIYQHAIRHANSQIQHIEDDIKDYMEMLDNNIKIGLQKIY